MICLVRTISFKYLKDSDYIHFPISSLSSSLLHSVSCSPSHLPLASSLPYVFTLYIWSCVATQIRGSVNDRKHARLAWLISLNMIITNMVHFHQTKSFYSSQLNKALSSTCTIFSLSIHLSTGPELILSLGCCE